ncbi:unnamed protein product [Lota lota]
MFGFQVQDHSADILAGGGRDACRKGRYPVEHSHNKHPLPCNWKCLYQGPMLRSTADDTDGRLNKSRRGAASVATNGAALGPVVVVVGRPRSPPYM